MRILYLEDEPDTARLIQYVLLDAGHSVDYAQTADQAIQLFDASSKSPYDLIITDIEMPGHLGLTFASHARQNGYSGRIIVLTGHSKESMMHNIVAVDGEYWQKAPLEGSLEGQLRTLTRERPDT